MVEREGERLSAEYGLAIFDAKTGELVWASDPWRYYSREALLRYVRWRNRHGVTRQIAIPWDRLA